MNCGASRQGRTMQAFKIIVFKELLMLLERVHSMMLSGKKKIRYDLVNYMNTLKD